ncbi:hypothetical protein D3C80_1654410 [compost metagenome]
MTCTEFSGHCQVGRLQVNSSCTEGFGRHGETKADRPLFVDCRDVVDAKPDIFDCVERFATAAENSCAGVES